MKMRALALLALLLATAAQAQQRQPANVSTLPATSPQEFDLLDNHGNWMPFGTASAGAFSLYATGTATLFNSFAPSATPTVGNIGLYANERVSGTACAPQCFYNLITVNHDSVSAGTGNGYDLFVNGVLDGGSSVLGGRAAGGFQTILAATTGNTTNGGATYEGLDAYSSAQVSDGGTAGTPLGHISGINTVAKLQSGATNFAGLQGEEIDVTANAGSSTYAKEGLAIVQFSTDVVAASSTWDGALVIANQAGAVGWKGYGIAFGGFYGTWPFQSSATAIGCLSPCGALANVLDFSGATISGSFLHSPGFNVLGTGVTSVAPPNALQGNQSSLIVKGNDGTNGGQISLSNSSGSAVNPNKYLRVSAAGSFQIINSAYTGFPFSLDDLGNGVFGAAVSTAGYTIGGTLPACGGSNKGANAFVTNGQASPPYLGAVATTGAVVAPVFCNGSGWVYH